MRAEVFDTISRYLADLQIKPSRLAREAKVATTTLTRFLADPDTAVSVPSTRTMAKLKDAYLRLRSERAAPNIEQLAKDPKKRALLTRAGALSDDQWTVVADFVDSILGPPAPPRSARKK